MKNEYNESGINFVNFSEFVFIDKNLEGYVDKLTFSLDFTVNKTKGLMTGGERFNNINNREKFREGLRNLSNYIWTICKTFQICCDFPESFWLINF